MPNPGVVNNPGGDNGTSAFGTETAYGAQKRMEQMTRASPLPAAPGKNAPRRSQRRAVSGRTATPAALPQPPAVAQQITPGAAVAQAWAAIAADPNASDLVRQYAQEAQLGT